MKTNINTIRKILNAIQDDPNISIRNLVDLLGLSKNGIVWNIDKLKEHGVIKRVGPINGGHWEIINSE
jgi:ATP-dependent DNA helicase RecG